MLQSLKKVIFSCILLVFVNFVDAQEFNAQVTILTAQLPNSANKSMFTTLQTQLNDFLNKRKWSSDAFQPAERIDCNVLINLSGNPSDAIYNGTITIQASRPVYGSSYASPILNYQDKDFVFKYLQGQPIDFSMSRIAGSDPLTANLPAILAYYINIILGLEYDSFSKNAGDVYFKNAQTIVAGAPSDNQIKGWTNFDGLRNRYWLAENLTAQRLHPIHEIIYKYYRDGLDQLQNNMSTGQANVLDAIKQLQNLNIAMPNSMIVQQFLESKSTELTGIFKKAPTSMKSDARDLLSQLDASNVAKYSSELK